MTLASLYDRKVCFSLSGKVGFSNTYGFMSYGVLRFGVYSSSYGIWQKRLTTEGILPVRMRFYRPTNPESVAQQANRAKFGQAMAEWSGLTDSERLAYTKRAKKRNMFGWGLFIREYYQSQ